MNSHIIRATVPQNIQSRYEREIFHILKNNLDFEATNEI